MGLQVIRIPQRRSRPLQKYIWIAESTSGFGVQVQGQQFIHFSMLPEGSGRRIAVFVDPDESTSPVFPAANADPTIGGIKTNWLPG